MKRILFLFCWLGVFCVARGQTRLHYWFDTHDDKRSTIVVNDANHLTTQLNVDDLSEGFHALYIQAEDAKGNMSAPIVRTFIRPLPLTGELHYRCWFDGDESTAQTGDLVNGSIMLNVSKLTDGLHTVYVQAYGAFTTTPLSYTFLKVPNVAGNELLTYICLIDEKEYIHQTVSGSQEVIHVDLNVAQLSQGIHKLQVMLAAESGAMTSAYTAYFYRAILQSEVEATRLSYMIDGKPQAPVTVSSAVNGALHYDLDVSSLSNGLHSLTYSLMGASGVYATGTTQWFYKIPEGGEGLISYEYWLNDDELHMRHVDMTEHLSAYQLVTLLPVDKAPIRSSLFQFAYRNDTIPVVYSKNDFHVRFWESGGSYALAEAQYVDERVCDTIHADTLREQNTIAVPKKNEIHWFSVKAKKGDSLSIKTDKACLLQIFSPSAKEVYTADALQSLQWGGLHARETGMFYVALHDVMSDTASTVSLYSQHINRYAVMGQDVHKVGNGGVSTITFEGNGFDSLYAVYFVDVYNYTDTIRGEYIGHENNNKTSVIFDFTDVALGEYDAVFEFADDEEIYLDENIVVEEPKDIILTSTVNYPSSFLLGETVTYELTITNEGNMTAYNVPIYVYIGTQTYSSISYLKFNGLNLSSIIDGINYDSLDINGLNEFKKWSEKMGDDHYFLKFLALDSISGDSIWMRSNFFFSTIAPYETKKLSLTIVAADFVDVWFSLYDTMAPLLGQTKNPTGQRFLNAKFLKSKEGLCCVKEQVECTMDLICHGLDRASIMIMDGALAGAIVGLGTFNPEILAGSGFLMGVSELSGASSCMCSSFSTGTKIIGNISCDDNDGSSVYEKIRSALVNNNKSTEKTLFNCLLQALNVLGTAYSTVNHWNEVYEASKLGTLYALNAYIHGGNGEYNPVVDCISKYHKVPDCFPRPPKGGKSEPVDSSDPNDIIGYTSEAGSKYMRQEIENVNYIIEFENDQAFATAPAHTVIIRDTLDATRFDLTSFTPTDVTIGDRSMRWETTQSGSQTLDMRTRMNVIAQVGVDYNAEKGIAQWTISSLDPMTMEPIKDANIGVLPVNYNGNGMGAVSFSIKLKDKFADGTQIANKASIIFDNNAPIVTPVWVNTIDEVKPSSTIKDVQIKEDSIHFEFERTDNRSGIWYSAVYARENDEAEWQMVAKADSDIFSMQLHDGIMQFYVLAIDSAGNVEVKAEVAEYSIGDGVATYYLITFYDEDGLSIIDQRKWIEGVLPTCRIPQKPEDANYIYAFSHWQPDVVPVIADADYIAVYTRTEKTSTSIEDNVLPNTPHKILREGKLYILYGNHVYDAHGQKIK